MLCSRKTSYHLCESSISQPEKTVWCFMVLLWCNSFCEEVSFFSPTTLRNSIQNFISYLKHKLTRLLYLQDHVWIQILNSDSRKQQQRPKTLPAAFLCVFCSVFGSNFSPHYNEPLQCITKARVMCRSISRGHCWIYFWCQKAECCHTAQDCKKLIIWVRFKFKLQNNTDGDIL